MRFWEGMGKCGIFLSSDYWESRGGRLRVTQILGLGFRAPYFKASMENLQKVVSGLLIGICCSEKVFVKKVFLLELNYW